MTPPRSSGSRLRIASASRDRVEAVLGQTHRRFADVQRMFGRENGAAAQVGDHTRIQRFGQCDAFVEGFDVTRHAADHDQRLLRGFHDLDGFLHVGRCRHRNLRCGEAFELRHRQRLRELLFLHRNVEHDVGGSVRRGRRDFVRARDRIEACRDRSRFVVPLRVVAHERGRIARGMDPVDPRAALGGIMRAVGAEHDDRHAVAPRAVERHRGVHQTDVGVNDRQHRFFRHLGITVRDRDRVLFVQAHEHLRILGLEVVHEAVVQSAVARAGHERRVIEF